QPGFADPNPALPPPGGRPATPEAPAAGPAPSGSVDVPEDPLKDLGEPLRERLEKTTAYDLIVSFLHAAGENSAKPAPPGNEPTVRTVPPKVAAPRGGFILNDSILRRVMAVNAFPLDGMGGLVFFGLRGCLPADASGSAFAESQALKVASLNYNSPRCT